MSGDTERIPMASPDITDVERRAVQEVLGTSHLSFGPFLERFEAEFASAVGARHAIAVSSGTAGLHLSLIAAEVGTGDMVITSPFSFVASANPILYEGGIPIFVDVDPETLNIDPARAAEAAAELAVGPSGARRWLPPALRQEDTLPSGLLKALLPVHVFGQPADLASLVEIAGEHGLTLVEDACEAIGAEHRGRMAGTFGDAAVFAFYPNKQMTTGEGGMIVTDHDDWDALFRSLRNQGRDVFDAWLEHSRLGYNYRMDEMSAALGVVQLSRLDELLSGRRRAARLYEERLEAVEGVQAPRVHPATTRMSWFVYVVRLDPGVDRDAVMVSLEESGIPSRPYFTPIHLQPFYQRRFGFGRGDFPVTEQVARSTLALPFFGGMTEGQVERVCERLDRAVRRHRTIDTEIPITQQ